MGQAVAPIMFAQGALSLVETYQQQGALKAQDRFQKTQADINARMMEIQAQDAIRAGETEAGRIGRQTRQIRGAQRAAYAGQGVDVSSGSAAAVAAETQLFGEMDQETVRNNAWREAWGYRSQADQVRLESRIQSAALRTQRRATIATGGLRAIGQFGQAYGSVPRSGFVPRNPTERRFDREFRGR